MLLMQQQELSTEVLPESNFFLGNVSSYITTASICADFFAYPIDENTSINESDIENFNINGNDVSFYINKEVVLKANSGIGLFSSLTSISYLIDKDSYLKNYTYRAFQLKTGIRILARGLVNVNAAQPFRYVGPSFYHYYPNLLSIKGVYFFQSCNPKRVYLPNCVLYGSSNAVQNNIFNAITSSTIYVHPSMLTINSGAMEADLALAQTNGSTIVAVLNTTPPDNITNLSYNNLTATTVDLVFTNPTSVNSLAFYEVWIDDGTDNPFYKYLIYKEISGSGATLDLTGLVVSGLKIKLAACDIYWNGSGYSDTPSFSNEITIV